jgi:glycosyltransferase involved in cell wall biosynthesis
MAKALAVHPRRSTWVERYEFSGLNRAVRSRVGARRAAAVAPRPDALLQIGAWYDFSDRRSLSPLLRCSYHDCNLALALAYPRFVEDAQARHIGRTLKAERRVYDRLDTIFTMSEWLRRSFIEDFEQEPEKVVCVGAGANLVELPEPPQRRRPEPPRYLFVGFDFERKGGPDVVAAFAAVRDRNPRAELWIVGPAARGDDRDGVRWLGPVRRTEPGGDAEIGRLYDEATAFVLPSRFEPFGIVFCEAMLHGLPCIAADACAMPEIVADGETGRLVAPGDVDALAAAMVELADPGRAEALGAAGRKRALERFTWDRVVARVVERLARDLS